MEKEQDHDHSNQQAVQEQASTELSAIFKKMPNEIPLLLITSKAKNDQFNEAAKQIIRAIRTFTSKITLKEFDIAHDMAKKWNVQYTPTILFDPEHYNIRWLGAPLGEEGRTFVEALIMMGYQAANLSEASSNILEKLDSPRNIKVFVSPTCPYCPQQAVNALKATIAKPDLISLEIIDIQANPELADKYNAQSVPQVFANE
ncbi:MAG: thioredoxin family protein, partial [Desulfobacterales bacterium]|nr:thioredoxin family protein [Desulfobacterales bacterium]